MAVDKKKIAADCWKRGNDALAKDDWDFAITMYTESVKLVPDNLTYRQTLRGAECRKYKNNKTGARRSTLKLMGPKSRIKKGRLKKDWEAIDLAAEDGLAVNPWDPQLNADMAQACLERGFDEAAVFGFQRAVEAEPEDKNFNRSLALLLELRGNYADAIKCWQRIQQVDPLDTEARTKVTHLEARSVMEAGGYEGAESTREVQTGQSAYDADRPVKQQHGPETDGPGVSEEADLQRAIRKEPENQDHYMKLGALYRKDKQWDEAAEMFQKAMELSGGDHNIREQLEDVELGRLQHNCMLAREASRKEPDNETTRKNAVALSREFLLREIEVFSSRVERYPKDLKLKFDLAKRFMRCKKWPKAIQLLQQASVDNRLEGETFVLLGDCFLADKQNKLGMRQYEKALPKINEQDRPDLFKKANYALGVLCEKAGQLEKAEDHLSEILAIDYEYRDVRQRLEKLQSGEDKEQE